MLGTEQRRREPFRMSISRVCGVAVLADGLSLSVAPLAALAFGLASFVVPNAAQAAVNSCPVPISHHGISRVPDSMRGFKAAASRGVGFEADLRTTKDGHVVLMHNRKVNATTNGTGLVAHKTLVQIERLRLDDGTRVPTLHRALDFVANHLETSITLDLKALTGHTQATTAVDIANLGLQDRTLAISFLSAMLLHFHADNPGVRTALIFTHHAPSVNQVAPYGGGQLAASLASAAWVSRMHAAGFEAGMRVTNRPADWQRGKDWGFDRVLTDHIDGYLSWCAGQTQG